MKLTTRTASISAALLLVVAGTAPVQAASRMGRAVVARMRGTCEYVAPQTTTHDSATRRAALRQGMALSEPETIVTGEDGRMCVVLTPGAILCVSPQTEVKLVKLEQITEGLPSNEKELIRKISLDVTRGSILMYGGVPSPTLSIEVKFPAGTIRASGGRFVLWEDKGQWLIQVETHAIQVVYAGGEAAVSEGQTLLLRRDAPGGPFKVVREEKPTESQVHLFDICRTFFSDLAPMVLLPDGANLGGLSQWIGGTGDLTLVGDQGVWQDVSPSFRVPPTETTVKAALPGVAETAGRMGREDIWAWYRSVGVMRGLNYVPRNAVNSTEMWQKDTFNSDIVAEEMKWAREAGFNVARVPLQFVVWKSDSDGFKSRFDKFLDLAKKNGIRVVPILFDDSRYSGKDPYLGKQDDPVPGLYNSAWTPSPGAESVTDRKRWGDLERYVRDMVHTYRGDRRILFWDLYQTPGNAGLWDRSLPLLESSFKWAREEKPRQPLTAGPWTEFGSPMSVRIMELSDLISVQTFDDPAGVRARLAACRAHERPVVCTDWLKRQKGNTFEAILPIFAKEKVGWFSRGLVKGRAQWYVPEESKRGDPEPKVWQQDLLQPDGKPYDKKEIELIRAFHFID